MVTRSRRVQASAAGTVLAVLAAGFHPAVAGVGDDPAWQGPADPAELERFVDPIFAQQMQQLHVPGAVFVLVNDGKVLLESARVPLLSAAPGRTCGGDCRGCCALRVPGGA